MRVRIRNRPRQRGHCGDPGRRLGEAKAVNLEIRGGDLGRPRQPISAEARDARLSATPEKPGPGQGAIGPDIGEPEMSEKHIRTAAKDGREKDTPRQPGQDTSQANWYRPNGALWARPRQAKPARPDSPGTAPAGKQFLNAR